MALLMLIALGNNSVICGINIEAVVTDSLDAAWDQFRCHSYSYKTKIDARTIIEAMTNLDDVHTPMQNTSTIYYIQFTVGNKRSS